APPAESPYDLPRKRLPPRAKPRPAPATTRSFAVVEKLGEEWAGAPPTSARTRALEPPHHESALLRVVPPQFATTRAAPVLRLPPVAGLRSRSAPGPKPDPSKLHRTSHERQNPSATHRLPRPRGAPAELAPHRNIS